MSKISGGRLPRELGSRQCAWSARRRARKNFRLARQTPPTAWNVAGPGCNRKCTTSDNCKQEGTMKLRRGLVARSGISGHRDPGAVARAQLAGEFPEAVRASVAVRCGDYDARRLRSQREVIRDDELFHARQAAAAHRQRASQPRALCDLPDPDRRHLHRRRQ